MGAFAQSIRWSTQKSNGESQTVPDTQRLTTRHLIIQLGKRCQSTAPLLATSDNPSELLKSARSNFRPRKITRSTQLAQPYSTAWLEPDEQTSHTSSIPSDSDKIIRSAALKAGHESRLTLALEMPTIAKSSQRGNGDFQSIC